jgi:hypothetical protein
LSDVGVECKMVVVAEQRGDLAHGMSQKEPRAYDLALMFVLKGHYNPPTLNNIYAPNVRRNGPQPRIFVRSFSAITRYSSYEKKLLHIQNAPGCTRPGTPDLVFAVEL